jgi:FkbM family methyltransferase
MRLRVSEYPDGAMYFGVFEVATVRRLRSLLRPGDRAIDVGANIGFMTLHMASRVGTAGQVHSFEPVPGNRARLEQAIADNGFPQVHVHPEGLGEKADHTVIYDFTSSGAHAESSLRPLHANATAVPCEIVRLDEVVTDPVRLIKVDVEGAEVGVFRGATELIRACKPHLIVENNLATLKAFGHTFADVHDAIRSAHDGYEAFLLRPFTPRFERHAMSDESQPSTNVWFRPKAG